MTDQKRSHDSTIFRLSRSVFGLFILLTFQTQSQSVFQTDFPPEEFKARWEKLFDKIGSEAIAVVQGGPSVAGADVYRQSNEFYYLCGIETPRAHLVLDGRSRKVTLYLPHRDEGREKGEGPMLTAEDAELTKKLTGVDRVAGVEFLARDWQWTLYWTAKAPTLFTPFYPAEGMASTRDMMQGFKADIAADPWDGRASREGQFIQLLRTRFPEFEIRNLSPFIDTLRNIKSKREISLLRASAKLASLGLMAAMRSTKPDVFEYQLGAAAQYVFQIHGAQGDAYHSIVAGGKNSMMGHYFLNNSRLKEGDLLLMDYAPDYRYYASDVTRMWPVNGTFSAQQKQLWSFIVAVHDAILKRVRPGVTPDQILIEAADEFRTLVDKTPWIKPEYKTAAEKTIKQKNSFSHPVGMAVHDIGNYRPRPLEPGVVFSLDPGIVIESERLVVRIENVILVTSNGAENLSASAATDADAIERVMRERGILQTFPATTNLEKE